MDSVRWSWIEMCGPGGLVPWNPTKRDAGTCFQQIFLQIPVLSVFAIMSAFYLGRRPRHYERHNMRTTRVKFRAVISFCLAASPIIYTCLGIIYAYAAFRLVDYFSSAVEAFAWFVHTFYILSLKQRRNHSGPVLIKVLWTLTAVLSVIDLRTTVITFRDSESTINQLSYGISIAEVILQCLYGITLLPIWKRRVRTQNIQEQTERSYLIESLEGFNEEDDPEYLGVAMSGTTWFSKLLFHWPNTLMKKGKEKKLKSSEDLFDLPNNLKSVCLYNKLHTSMCGNKYDESSIYGTFSEVDDITNKSVTLLKALHTCFGIEFYSIGILKFLSDMINFAGPLLLNKLVSFIDSGATENIKFGYLYAFGLFVTTLSSSILITHFNFMMAKVGMKIRGAIITTVYRKTLYLSNSAVSKFSLGEIVNFMSTDTDRIVNSCPSFHACWSIPLQISVTFFLLYKQVGLAFFAGVLFTILLIPINKFIASKIGQFSTKLMKEKDERVANMTEILTGIRVLKMHVWEEHFMEKVFQVRKVELKYLKCRKYLDALCVYFWATTPVVISILTFSTYSLMGNQLDAATVFTTMALLNMLIGPLNAFPWVLNGLTEAFVSIKRIQKLFDVPDLSLKKYYEPVSLETDDVFCLDNCLFTWPVVEKKNNTICPDSTSYLEEARQNRKGSGKKKRKRKHSRTTARKGKGAVAEVEVAGAAAEPAPCVSTCFRLQNISLHIKRGELIGVIGEVGSGKSSLLSALLGEIEKVEGTISMCNIDSGCAYVSQTSWIQCDTLRENILFGKPFDSSRYKRVLDACCLLQDVEMLHGGDLVRIGDSGMTLSGGQRARLALARAVYQDKDVYILDDVLSAVDAHVARQLFNRVICGLLKQKTRIFSTHCLKYVTSADTVVSMRNGTIYKVGPPQDVLSDVDDDDTESEQDSNKSTSRSGRVVVLDQRRVTSEADDAEMTERSESGTLSHRVYSRYWTSIGHLLSLLILMSMLLMQSSRNVTDWWLSYWVTQTSNVTQVLYATETNYYLLTYTVLTIMNSLFTLFRAFVFAYGGVTAAKTIHEKLLKRVLFSKTTFFDISPVGRILNRFSSDTYTIDDSLPFILNILLAQLFGLLGSLFVTVYGLPWLCLVIVPLAPVYHWIQVTYRQSSRELKRLSSVTLSPIYSHFNETLHGLSTIRAFRSFGRFKKTNEDYLEQNQKAQFSSQAASQWLNMRLQLVGVTLVTGVGLVSVLQHQFDVADPGLVGLAISYALSITGLLSGVVSAFTETEKELISLERVGQYIEQIETESESGNSPPYAWPSQGVIVFDSVYLKYRESLAPSLNGISFSTRPAEKIGVVGRTGAGKSSMIAALLRLVELFRGDIYIDAVNIKLMSLQGLRSRIAVIPQDPFLFEGTLRDNLDPLSEYNDMEINNTLDKCNLRGLVERVGGVTSRVMSGGANYSQGQKQLLCLARAVLHNAKIVCVDEATASVDDETDRQIQHTIRSSFRQSTVLTIAHRISTIMDCNRVLVLGDGEIIEFDSPQVLIMDKNSYFYRLANQDS